MKKVIFSVMLLLSLTGCGTYRQSVQVEDNAYLLLIGYPQGQEVLIIDDSEQIDLVNDVQSFDLNGKNAIKIQISAGTHNIKIIRDGAISVDRNFYVSTGNSFEVQL